MNANELADLLDKCIKDGSTDLVCVEQAATMLRRQAGHIAVLEESHNIHLEISNKQIDYIKHLEEGLESSLNLNKAQAERQQK
jgi:hypothetical protein